MLYRDYNKPKDPYWLTSTMESKAGYFSWLSWNTKSQILPPEINMSPEKGPVQNISEQQDCLPTIIFQLY